MKLSKAIKVQKTTLHQYGKHWLSDQRDAMKLGIEALKRVETFREQHFFQAWIPLPGETPEEEVDSAKT